ncbi:MAG: SDR family oxidoreductase [Alphaproteobacteria bacterium]|nr:SDR family oxidoreductase [Alphaproteobacteria bacterium]
MDDLKDKACLVTGASRGIGAAVARGLGACGARVAVHYNTARAEAEAVAADIARLGGKAVVLKGDVTDPAVPERLVAETVKAFGRLDILINNAGDQIVRKTIVETDDALIERHIAVNIRSVVAATRGAVRQFKAQGGGGSIVNVTSIAARTGGGGGSSIYAGTKGFVSTFTRAMAKEVVGDRVRVNAVSPGIIDTPLQHRVTPPAMLKTAVATVPMGRLGTSEECVGAFLYLCSDKLSSYVTGQVVEVNGGIVMP